MSKDEEELRRLAVELRILEGTAESLRSRLGLVNVALNELSLANMTLEGVEKEKSDAPLFVPMGGGSYIKAKLETPDRIVYGVGAGVAVEKTVKESKEAISNRISELNRTKMSLEQQLTQVLGRIEEDQSRLNELAEKIQGEAGARNV